MADQKVVNLFKSTNEGLIEVLESTLVLAKKGRINGFIFVAQTKDSDNISLVTKTMDDLFRLNYTLDLLKENILHPEEIDD